MAKTGYVYILASKSRRLYTGVTSELQIRVKQQEDSADCVAESYVGRLELAMGQAGGAI